MIYLVIIPAVVLSSLLSFWIGVRYCTRTLMPVILAKMSTKELGELAKRTAEERESQ